MVFQPIELISDQDHTKCIIIFQFTECMIRTGSNINSKYLFCHFTDTIGDQCADEIERVLEQRAISVNLHPEIEDQVHFNFTKFSEICQL